MVISQRLRLSMLPLSRGFPTHCALVGLVATALACSACWRSLDADLRQHCAAGGACPDGTTCELC